MGKKHVHILPRIQGWAVKKEGSSRASSLHRTQKQAIQAGRQMAMINKSELVIHGKDGKIRDKDSYGKDSFPPRDTKH